MIKLLGFPRRHPVLVLFVFLFALHSALNVETLLPGPTEVNPVDYPRFLRQAQLVMNGLAEGRPYIPGYVEYPAAWLLYVPFRGSADWLMLTGWTGSIMLNAGLWLTAFLVARRMPLQPVTSIAAGGYCSYRPSSST